MCPFCYIGKRRFEAALANFPHKDQVELEWKSYQLDPNMQTDVDVSYVNYLSANKGMSLEQAQGMLDQVTTMAKEDGLNYNFDKAVVANSFRSHELSHFAKQQGKQDEAEELLFKSFFEEGKNIDDVAELKAMATTLGLDAEAFEQALAGKTFEDAVREDIYEAQQIGVRGVPFFVYDRKYAVSGAQPAEVFGDTINKAFDEWKKENNKPLFDVVSGPSCGPEGCD